MTIIRLLLSAGVLLGSIYGAAAEDETTERGLAGTYLSAFHALMNAKAGEAADFYAQALEYDPHNQDLLRQAYFLKSQVGDIEGALPFAKKSYAARPQLSIAPLIVAITHYKEGRYEEAASLVDKLSASRLVFAVAPMLKAWSLAPNTDYARAAAALAPYEGQQETRAVAALMSGLLNEYYGRDEAALVYYRALAESIDRQPLSVMRVIIHALHRLGQSDEADKAIARARNSIGNNDLADAHFDVYADPENTPRKVTANIGMAEALFAAAQIQFGNSGRNRLMMQVGTIYAQLALYLNPELGLVKRVIANAMIRQGQSEQAIEVLNSIPSDAPEYLWTQIRKAEILQRLGRTDQALELLRQIAANESEMDRPWAAIGDILRAEERFAEAVDAYNSAFSKYPNGEAPSWRLYYNRGIALERIQEWNLAEADFKKALELNPEEADVLNYLGYSWLDRGENVEEARRMIELAVEKQPDNGYIIDSLGWAMFLMGEYEDAVIQLERAVNYNPSDPTINEHLGDAYWQVGRQNEARFQWRRALALEPESHKIDDIRAKLERGLAQK